MKLRWSPLTIYHKKLAWKNVKIFTQSPFSDFLEILASEATENPSPKWEKGLRSRGQQRILKVFLRYAGVPSSVRALSASSAGLSPGLLSPVCFLVADEIGAAGEMLPARGAPVGLLAPVGPLVRPEVGDVAEGPPALGALVGPLARVGAVMYAEAGAVAEALPALAADVGRGLQVGPVVHRQRRALAEALATEVAAEGPPAQVVLLVRGEVRVPPEALLAVGALVVLLLQVDALVPDPVGASGEALTALGTLVRLLARVDALVRPQVGGVVEGFATLDTYKGLLIHLGPPMSREVLRLCSRDSDFLRGLFWTGPFWPLRRACLPRLFFPIRSLGVIHSPGLITPFPFLGQVLFWALLLLTAHL